MRPLIESAEQLDPYGNKAQIESLIEQMGQTLVGMGTSAPTPIVQDNAIFGEAMIAWAEQSSLRILQL